MIRHARPIALPAVVALLALVTGACGIPDESGVTVVGAGPSPGITSGVEHDPGEISRDAASERVAFVENYLKVAAGDLDSAADRMRTFMTDGAKHRFEPKGADLAVIRLTAPPLWNQGSDVVQLSYEQVGTLDKFGLLEPASEARPGTYDIRVVQVAGQSGYFVADAPPVLLISVDALRNYYQEHTIYFWNTDYTSLVPDVRYMPDRTPAEQRPTTVMNWLVNGPAPWLSAADLADGTTLIGKVPEIREGKLSITLNTQGLPATDTALALDRLRRQLQWSLRPFLSGSTQLDLKFGHQEAGSYSGDDYHTSNLASRLTTDPEAFAIYDSRIRRISESAKATAQPPVLVPEQNKDIRRAAMASSAVNTYAAVVTGSGKSADVLKVAAAGTDALAQLQPISGLSGTLGTPTWAIMDPNKLDGAVGLITADGKLFSFAPAESRAQPIPWSGPGARISAIAVAPDGRRVVLVVDGRLFRASLTMNGDTPALGAPQQLRPAGLLTVTAVSFNSEDSLIVGGIRAADNRTTILDVSIDGALQNVRLGDLGDKPVESLASYPANPLRPSRTAVAVSYLYTGKAWQMLSTAQEISPDKLAGVTASQAPGNLVPTAPFYLE
ncbi:hypothetical protein Acy02nite_21830 [Actinoplanes cyaneus]|uniref:Lipoprotein LpqB C-terminal domain-containing protein n=1 Tax=Actinoplanes cyaneus TaxID=52696 RepID=A0A919IF68_9ACTN|nr:LpqB family beta-propeller domain-containing protein [Actinoplanes cyaneus]MCW2136551.1 Lipoprotein LpqB beta-propeller domain-containing protein [Actinoplanes cyaneus]GID64302.1 hypothetical protein Acy02nite_21830 [Actinoplanes cyaneus]